MASPDRGGGVAVERLASELDSLDEPLVLVIDDLHELRSAQAVAWLDLFLARLPSQLVVVLATREEPRVGLHRLRVAGELTELRASDLRFSLEETSALLKAAGIALSEAGVELLHERAEGWAAGLRLAVISLVEHPEPERFAREFSGSERTVAGYLLAEVLQRQPAEVRELLLRTSILDRVSGPLADFLTGNSGSERVLQQLEDANAFVSLLGCGAFMVPVSPAVRGPAAARAADACPGRPSSRCTVRRPSGTRHTGTSSRRSATPRRPGTGRTPRAYSPTTTSVSGWRAGGRPCMT